MLALIGDQTRIARELVAGEPRHTLALDQQDLSKPVFDESLDVGEDDEMDSSLFDELGSEEEDRRRVLLG